MPRVPYEIVAVEADRLIVRMALAPSIRQAVHYWRRYIDYIEACGWTDSEFDIETLKRIDRIWDLLLCRSHLN